MGDCPDLTLAACSPEPQRQTDVRRKIKDNWIDWDDYIQTWQQLNAQGQNIIAAIANTKLTAVINEEETDNCGDGLRKRAASIEKHNLHKKIEELCNQLVTVYTKMQSLVEKMEHITDEFAAMSDLQQFHFNSTSSSQATFEACDMRTFYSSSKTLSDQYRRELAVKETIVENVALTNDRNLLMRYKLTWWCQPYISDNNESLLEANLVATGLRK